MQLINSFIELICVQIKLSLNYHFLNRLLSRKCSIKFWFHRFHSLFKSRIWVVHDIKWCVWMILYWIRTLLNFRFGCFCSSFYSSTWTLALFLYSIYVLIQTSKLLTMFFVFYARHIIFLKRSIYSRFRFSPFILISLTWRNRHRMCNLVRNIGFQVQMSIKLIFFRVCDIL